MFIQRNSLIVVVLFSLLTLSACGERKEASAKAVEKPTAPAVEQRVEAKVAYFDAVKALNGTWTHSKEATKIPESEWEHSWWEYSWGTGKSIPNTTVEIDLGRNDLLLAGDGGFDIRKIRELSPTSIAVDVTFPRSNTSWLHLVFHFIDQDTFWIEEKDLGWFPHGKEELWYRLSGPPREEAAAPERK